MKKIKIVSVILLLFVVFVVASNYVRSHGFIDITVNDSSQAKLKYTLVNKESGSEIKFVSKDGSLKKLVNSGRYEIYVQSETSSYISSVVVKSFLATTTEKGKLVSEDAREFVGYNPNPCTAYLAEKLYSHDCKGNLNTVLTHVPATSNQPTYNIALAGQESIPIVGTAQTKFGRVILAGAVFKSEEELLFDYSVGILGENFSIQNRRFINTLPFYEEFEITAFRDGFLIYSPDLSKAFYYSSLSAEAERIDLPKAKDKTLKPVSLRAQDKSLVLLYSNASIGDESSAVNSPKSEVVVLIDDAIQRYEFEETISSVALCDMHLCVASDSVLTIYKLESKKLIAINEMTGVQSMQTIDNKLYFLNQIGLFTMDTKSLKGSFSYSFGDYKYCGIQNEAQGYILCLIDSKQNKVALRILTGVTTNLAVDKRISDLQSQPGIVDVSAYKNIVFVTPDIDPVKSEFDTIQKDYTEKQITHGREVLSKAIKASRLPIDTLTIVNTTAPF